MKEEYRLCSEWYTKLQQSMEYPTSKSKWIVVPQSICYHLFSSFVTISIQINQAARKTGLNLHMRGGWLTEPDTFVGNDTIDILHPKPQNIFLLCNFNLHKEKLSRSSYPNHSISTVPVDVGRRARCSF